MKKRVNFNALPKIETPAKNVDVKFLEAMDFKVTVLKYYQIALEHPDLRVGRFMWYPTTGTLVHEGMHKNRPLVHLFDTENVVNYIMKVISEQ